MTGTFTMNACNIYIIISFAARFSNIHIQTISYSKCIIQHGDEWLPDLPKLISGPPIE